MQYPFHLSFVVPDLAHTARFYKDVLGCVIGRDTGHWLDVHFFGHQLTLHQATENMHANTIDHFGVILDKSTWHTLIETCQRMGHDFVLAPQKALKDDQSESGKFMLKDPADNLLEFKFYEKPPVEPA